MELIINSKKYGKFTILYDSDDYEKIKKNTWFIQKQYGNENLFYVVGKTIESKFKIRVLMHRYIVNCPKDLVVDHINHNTLDNRKKNLRICTQKENNMNTKSRKNASSIYKGVSWSIRDKIWYSFICKNKKTINLGCYKNEIDAALVYNGAAKYLFGEYANLNEVLL